MPARHAPSVVHLAHAWIEPVLAPGTCVVDATAGNGHDTLFLARGVAPHGVVHAFDIQARALARARRRLARAGPAARVIWHRASHARLARHLGEARPSAVMFNLGWLPGGDHGRITRPDGTITALERAAACLRPGGRISVVAYRGHAGGAEEDAAVAAWLQSVHALTVLSPLPPEPRPTAPVLYRLERPSSG